jgi:hypothetical protein
MLGPQGLTTLVKVWSGKLEWFEEQNYGTWLLMAVIVSIQGWTYR